MKERAPDLAAGGNGAKVDSIWVSALRAAAEVTRRATSSEADVLRAVSEELRKLHVTGGVALMKEDGRLEFRARILSGALERTLKRLTGLDIQGFSFDPADVPAYARVLQEGEAVFLPDREQTLRQLIPERLRSLAPVILRLVGGSSPTIIAPLATSERPLGTITVTADWLTGSHTPMLAALADHIAIALNQVRAREKMHNTLERERQRNQVAQTVSSALELPVVLKRVIELAVEVSGADAGAFALLQPDGETMEFPYTYGLPEGTNMPSQRRGQGLAWRMIETGEPLLLQDYSTHEDALQEWADAGLHAFLGLPLFVGDEPIGAMGLFKKRPSVRFHPEQLELTQSIANMAAIAVKNAQLYRQMERRADESHALIETSSSISASLDLETVLRLIAEQVKRLLDADGSRIHMLEPSEGVLRTLVALDPHAEAMMDMTLEPGVGLAGHVLETGEAMIVNDPASDPRSEQVPGTPDNERECLALAPLNIRQRAMGVMAVRRFGLDRPFRPSDLHLLTAFAAHAAVAIENADLYGQIERQAQRLEQQVIERTRDLARSEARYRGLVETSLTGILHIGPDERVSYANEVFADLVAMPVEEIEDMHIEQAIEKFLPEETRADAVRRFRERISGKLPQSEVYELEFLGRDGVHVPTIFAVNRIEDDEGTSQGVTCLALDISQRKALETALRAERDRLEAILTNIGDAVLVTDPEGKIEYVNAAWERLNGYTRAEALGQDARETVGALERSSSKLDEFWRAIQAGQPWHGELINQRKDGSKYDAAVIFTPIHGEGGGVVNFVGVLHDISALKELDRLKSRFVSDVSHELRTPLTNIRLYIDLLSESESPARRDEYIETLSRESERLAHLIDDLLSLSRLEAGATPFRPRPVDVNQLIHNLSSDRSALAADRDLEIRLETQSDLPSAMGDERLLTQVFTNLLTNAMNYTPGGGQITLRTEHEQHEGRGWIVAEVQDTGMGIEPDEKSMIFRRFFRGKASQSTGAPGTGLGLSICKEIAELHGGRLKVDSEPGEGTRVSVWLPSDGHGRPD